MVPGLRINTNTLHALIFLALASLLCIADREPLHIANSASGNPIETAFYFMYDGVRSGRLQGDELGPYVYRILVPQLLAALHAVTGLAPLTLDLVLKLAALTSLQALAYAYLRAFFGATEALCGVLWLDAVSGYCLSFIPGPHITETSDILAACSMVACLLALHAGRHRVLLGLLLVSVCNRETCMLLLPAVFAHEWPRAGGVRRSLQATLAVLIPYLGLRLWIGRRPWFAWTVATNIPGLASSSWKAVVANVHVLLLLGPLLALGALGFARQSSFVRKSALIVPGYLLVHYLFGRVIENRLWLPLVPVLLPLAIGGLVQLREREPK